MAEYMHLIGAEDVQRAASRMQTAADDMQRAASSIDNSVERLLRGLDDFLLRFESAAALLANQSDANAEREAALQRRLAEDH